MSPAAIPNWIGKRLQSSAGIGPSHGGIVHTQRQGRDGRFLLGVKLESGGYVFVSVEGPPPADGAAITATTIETPPHSPAEARALALEILNGRGWTQRLPVESQVRLLAAALLTHLPEATP